MIEEEFLRAIEEEFDELSPHTLTKQSNLKELIDWNSLNTLIVAARIKQDYGIKLMPDDFKGLTTFKDLIELINKKLNHD